MAEGDVPESPKEQLPKPEDMAKSLKIEGEMEKIGWNPLKPVPERFSIGGSGDSSKTTEERLGEVANTPADELAKSSEWRRDALSSKEGSKPPGGMLIENLPEGIQIIAPLEGNVAFEYKNADKQADGSLSRGKVIIVSKDGISITMEADNIQLLVGSSTPTETSEEGIVKSSQEIPVKMGDPLFSMKNKSSEVSVNASQGTTTGNSSPATT